MYKSLLASAEYILWCGPNQPLDTRLWQIAWIWVGISALSHLWSAAPYGKFSGASDPATWLGTVSAPLGWMLQVRECYFIFIITTLWGGWRRSAPHSSSPSSPSSTSACPSRASCSSLSSSTTQTGASFTPSNSVATANVSLLSLWLRPSFSVPIMDFFSLRFQFCF